MKKIFAFAFCFIILFSCSSCKPGGTTMPDGSILYRMLNISNNKQLEFKDKDNNVLLDEKDIEWVYEKYSDDDGYYLILEFTTDGTEKLAKATADNIGKDITLFADGEEVYSAMINAEITYGRISIMGKASSYKQLMSLTEKIAGH